MEVIGLGALNMDKIIVVNEVLREGEALIKERRECAGGSAANTIFAMASHGVRCGFVGAVGDDEEGERIVAEFLRVGVDTGKIKVKRGKSGEALCIIDKEGRKAIYVSVGANALLLQEDIDLDYINSASLLHMSALKEKLSLQEYVVKNLKDKVTLSFAPGPIFSKMGKKALGNILKRVNVLFLNKRELQHLTGKMGWEEGMKDLRALGIDIVAVTAGEEGAVVYAEEKFLKVEQRKEVEVKDTTGAGDAFCAGFLMGYLQRKSIFECARLANEFAALCISQFGARLNKTIPS